MQHHLSYSNASTTIGNRASVRLARLAETEAPCAMQFKKTLDIANAGPTESEHMMQVEMASRAAPQKSAPQASSGAGYSDARLPAISPPMSSDRQRLRKSPVAITSFAVALP